MCSAETAKFVTEWIGGSQKYHNDISIENYIFFSRFKDLYNDFSN